jgi:hypothetical protein
VDGERAGRLRASATAVGPCTERGRLGGPLTGAHWAVLRAEVLMPAHAHDAGACSGSAEATGGAGTLPALHFVRVE